MKRKRDPESDTIELERPKKKRKVVEESGKVKTVDVIPVPVKRKKKKKKKKTKRICQTVNLTSYNHADIPWKSPFGIFVKKAVKNNKAQGKKALTPENFKSITNIWNKKSPSYRWKFHEKYEKIFEEKFVVIKKKKKKTPSINIPPPLPPLQILPPPPLPAPQIPDNIIRTVVKKISPPKQKKLPKKESRPTKPRKPKTAEKLYIMKFRNDLKKELRVEHRASKSRVAKKGSNWKFFVEGIKENGGLLFKNKLINEYGKLAWEKAVKKKDETYEKYKGLETTEKQKYEKNMVIYKEKVRIREEELLKRLQEKEDEDDESDENIDKNEDIDTSYMSIIDRVQKCL